MLLSTDSLSKAARRRLLTCVDHTYAYLYSHSFGSLTLAFVIQSQLRYDRVYISFFRHDLFGPLTSASSVQAIGPCNPSASIKGGLTSEVGLERF